MASSAMTMSPFADARAEAICASTQTAEAPQALQHHGPDYGQADMAGPAWWDLFQHHTSNGIGGNEANGVSLRIRNTNPAQWSFIIPGGDTTVGNKYGSGPSITETLFPFAANHWYDALIHTRWSTSSNGLCELWMDGEPIGSWSRSTLQYTGSTVDKPNYEFSNYHRHSTSRGAVVGNVTVYYGRLWIGTTRAIVGS